MITGFNPADMYAADHIRRVLETFPGRVHRHRRVHDPQGVRLVEGGRRHRQPDRPGARPHPRLRGRGRARRHPAQRHRHAVRQGGRGARLPDADEGPAAPSPEDHDHLGPHRPRPRRPPGAGPGERRRGGAQPEVPGNRRVDAERSDAEPRLFRHLLGRGGEVRRLVAGGDQQHGGDAEQVPGPLPVRHRQRRAGRPGDAAARVRPVGPDLGAADAGGEPEDPHGQLRAPVRRGAGEGARLGSREHQVKD